MFMGHPYTLDSTEQPTPITAMSFSVTKLSQGPVVPSEPTPAGTLPLSWLDRHPVNMCMVETLHVFRHGRDPAKVIRPALAKALVHYYPFAGRFVDSDQGEVQVACSGDGVWFVEASANCSLEEANYLEHPLVIPREQLLPDPHSEIPPADRPMMMQVTEFTCGGFVISLKTNHAMADGVGVANFLSAVAGFARALTEPTVKPVWCREAFPNPTKSKPGPLPDLRRSKLEYCGFDISLDIINKMKVRFMEETGRRCSTFEVLVAKVWQSRTRALKLDPAVDVQLCFPASTRHLLQLDEGYYGNCMFPVNVSTRSGVIADATLAEVVNRIRDAKGRMPVEFALWAAGELGEPFRMNFSDELLFVSDWSRLGFWEVDYGWGTPLYAGPLMENDFSASFIILKSPAPMVGIRLKTHCVGEEHFEAFVDQMKNLV